jgi:hypothetical protein
MHLDRLRALFLLTRLGLKHFEELPDLLHPPFALQPLFPTNTTRKCPISIKRRGIPHETAPIDQDQATRHHKSVRQRDAFRGNRLDGQGRDLIRVGGLQEIVKVIVYGWMGAIVWLATRVV